MELQRLVCTGCGRPIPIKDVNLERGMAKCVACNSAFILDDRRAETEAEERSAAPPSPPPVKPLGILQEVGANGELYLKHRWFTTSALGLLFFCIFWDSFLAVWYFMAVELTTQGKPVEIGMLILPLGHVSIGLVITYCCLAQLLNKTEIVATADTLYVRHSPFPWRGNRAIPLCDIDSVSTAVSTFQDGNRVERGQLNLSVVASLKNGEKIPLIAGLTREQAQYIGWCLSNHSATDFLPSNEFLGSAILNLPPRVQKMVLREMAVSAK